MLKALKYLKKNKKIILVTNHHNNNVLELNNPKKWMECDAFFTEKVWEDIEIIIIWTKYVQWNPKNNN